MSPLVADGYALARAPPELQELVADMKTVEVPIVPKFDPAAKRWLADLLWNTGVPSWVQCASNLVMLVLLCSFYQKLLRSQATRRMSGARK